MKASQRQEIRKIQVEQTVPVNFIVFDLFEPDSDDQKAIDILISDEFKAELREFWRSQAFDIQDLN